MGSRAPGRHPLRDAGGLHEVRCSGPTDLVIGFPPIGPVGPLPPLRVFEVCVGVPSRLTAPACFLTPRWTRFLNCFSPKSLPPLSLLQVLPPVGATSDRAVFRTR